MTTDQYRCAWTALVRDPEACPPAVADQHVTVRIDHRAVRLFLCREHARRWRLAMRAQKAAAR